ncbi:MAG: pyridoxal-phosphate dependent enzyme [Myxococcales bacterium]|nr:pyridoxal-phosphate dependent enzyme [Myxococcales bacterium]
MTTARAGTGVPALVGDTPLVRAARVDAGPCELWLKLETANPGGSSEDRVAAALVADAVAAGALAAGGAVVAAGSERTGLGLAVIAAGRGHPLTLVVPERTRPERVRHLELLGARCVLTRGDVGPDHAQHPRVVAGALARDRGAWLVELDEAAAARVHEGGLGPELWAQCEQRLDAVVSAGRGLAAGLARYLARVAPAAEVLVAVEPGAATAAAAADLPGRAVAVSARDTARAARELARAEGLAVGAAAARAVAAGLAWCRAQPAPRRCVVVVDDGGDRHHDAGDAEVDLDGGPPPPATGDLRDLVARRSRDGEVIFVSPADPLAVAYARMRASDVSQLPVLEDRKLVGIVDESDLLLAALGDAARGAASFERPVREVMSPRVETLPPTAGVHQLLPLFDRGMVGIVVDGDELLGLVTRVDLLNYLRRRAG